MKFAVKNRTLIVAVSGELDHHTAEFIRQRIDAEMIRTVPKNIIFDFSQLTFMDSSGIGVILGRYRNIQKLNGKAYIAGASSRVKKILEMSGLLKIIQVYSNVDTALKILGEGGINAGIQ